MTQEFLITTELEYPDLSGDRKDVNALLVQLSATSSPLACDDALERIAASGRLFLARTKDSGTAGRQEAVGMACMSEINALTDRYGWVNDVTVDERFRGNHLGVRLMEEIIAHATAGGLGHLDLTSNPKRKVANALYAKKLGFKLIAPGDCTLYVQDSSSDAGPIVECCEEKASDISISTMIEMKDAEDVRTLLASRHSDTSRFSIKTLERIKKNGMIFLVRLGGGDRSLVAVGCASRMVIPTGSVGLVSDILVGSGYEGRDFEKMLVAQCTLWAREKECRRVLLRADPAWFASRGIAELGLAPAKTNSYTLPLAISLA